MRIVVSIHDLPVWTIPPTEVARIARVLPDDEVIDAREPADRARAFPAADVLYATRLSADEVASMRRLTWIHSSAAGVGSLLTPAVVDSPVVVTNSRGVHSEAIAEHAIALALALRRDLHVAARRQMSHDWAQQEIYGRSAPPLSRATMLVVGLGTIGARVAAAGVALGIRVVGVRRRTHEPPPAGVSAVMSINRLRDALSTADIVVLTVPHTPDTRRLIGSAELAAMKPSAILVNVARGEIVDEPALVRALQSGVIAGAGLDAFEQEPLPADHPLWDLPGVLISPHTATFGGDYWGPIVDLFLDNVRRFKRGQPLLNPVDKGAGY